MSDVVLDITSNLSIPLTTFALTFEQKGAIADRVAPKLPVTLRAASFPKWDKKSFFQSGSAQVGPDGQVEEIKEQLLSDTYSVLDYARKIPAPLDEEAEYAALGINKEQRDAKKIMNYLAVERETRTHAIFSNVANYANTSAAPLFWTNAASTPLQDIALAKRSIIGSGMRKVLVLGRKVWDALRFNTQVLSALGRPGGQTMREIASASLADVASMMEVDEVLVSDLQFNNNNDGVAAMDRQFIWSTTSAALVVCPLESELSGDSLSFAITFRLMRRALAEIDFGGLPATAMMRRWFDENRGIAGTWLTLGGYSEDIKVVAPDAGYLLTATIA